MEKLTLFLVLTAITAVIGANKVTRTAAVYLKNDDVTGNITFEQVGDGPVKITGYITGLTDGLHGFHIHEKGDISTCGAAGGHYNPHQKDHGGPTATERHVGDLGNIESNGSRANISIEDDKISLIGEYSIVGRALVVHAKPDDLGLTNATDSKTTGNAGARVACGVIGIKNPVDKWPKGASASTTISGVSVGIVSIIAAILSVF